MTERSSRVLVSDMPPLGAMLFDLLVTDSMAERAGEVIVPTDQLRRVAAELIALADKKGVPVLG